MPWGAETGATIDVHALSALLAVAGRYVPGEVMPVAVVGGADEFTGERVDEDDALLAAYEPGAGAAARSRLALMRVVSDFREAMWGVLQQGISTLEVDFVAYADEHFDRLLANASTTAFEDALVRAANG